jgi:voltage-gated potassium channel
MAPIPKASFSQRLWAVIFEAETPSGKAFDVVLLVLIVASALCVMLESVLTVRVQHGELLTFLGWSFTLLFSVEYLVRLWVSARPFRYATSFFGLIDLLSCLPQYFALALGGGQGFAVVRILRLLRMFRVLKMAQYIRGGRVIMLGLREAAAKITVFFSAILLFSTLAGTLLYYVEGGEPETRFTSIPTSIYYAIVSVTTVGFGDITVQTDLGRVITSFMILSGFAIIAVPTGIVVADISRAEESLRMTTDACPGCGAHGHLPDATYCRRCATPLEYSSSPKVQP